MSASDRLAVSKPLICCCGQVRTDAGSRINARRPAAVKYAVTGIGKPRSGPCSPAPAPRKRWQGRHCTMLAAPGWITCGHAGVECKLRPTLQRIGVADQTCKRVGPLLRRNAGAFRMLPNQIEGPGRVRL